jgi:hypothetical protein
VHCCHLAVATAPTTRHKFYPSPLLTHIFPHIHKRRTRGSCNSSTNLRSQSSGQVQSVADMTAAGDTEQLINIDLEHVRLHATSIRSQATNTGLCRRHAEGRLATALLRLTEARTHVVCIQCMHWTESACKCQQTLS